MPFVGVPYRQGSAEIAELVDRARSAAQNASAASARASRETTPEMSEQADKAIEAALAAKRAARDAEYAAERFERGAPAERSASLAEAKSATSRALRSVLEALDYARKVVPALEVAYLMAADAAAQSAEGERPGASLPSTHSRAGRLAILVLPTLMMLSLLSWAATGNPFLLLIGAASALLVIPVLGTMRDAESAGGRASARAGPGEVRRSILGDSPRKIRMPAGGQERKAARLRR